MTAASSGIETDSQGVKSEDLAARLGAGTEVDLGTAQGTYALAARLNVSLPGLEREAASPSR